MLSFLACCVFTSRSLVKASNIGDYSASLLGFSLNGDSLSTDYLLTKLQTSPCYNISARTT
jgi:hypothetical protein